MLIVTALISLALRTLKMQLLIDAGMLIATALVSMMGGLAALLLACAVAGIWLMGSFMLLLDGSFLKAFLAFIFPPYGMIAGCQTLLEERRQNRNAGC